VSGDRARVAEQGRAEVSVPGGDRGDAFRVRRAFPSTLLASARYRAHGSPTFAVLNSSVLEG
jgi:hypothetical protein